MALKVQKEVIHNGSKILITYNFLTSELNIKSNDLLILRKSLWRPRSSYRFRIENKNYTIRAWIYPITKFSIFTNDELVCSDLYPKLKRYSLAMLATGPIRQSLILIAWALS